ncbi:raftlin isoform X2 [Pelodiscus sinensis]|uniref:Raftlin, lipid raft linker 1 n=1 Tax=Pelodiscus sinensis TaxID=13735 RepID=K7FRM2_PELSI|nr:raftlin isoform X2 [Pelodiscus sinensis]|eukprot:XP_014434145.1 raftlin isoform X2 [Pelodiscus sinensis]
MGCGLNKLEKRDEKRPGNIYSTLKRPQVETKIDVSYEYRFLEFTTLNDAELPRSSAIRLSSWRDLPSQLQELYQQGFILAAVHPFVQPTNEKERTPQEQIFRAVLIRKTERSVKSDVQSEGYTLEIESCFSSDQLMDKKKIPDFIEKIQEAASQGLKFVGVILQYSSQVSLQASTTVAPTGNNSTQPQDVKNTSNSPEDRASLDRKKVDGANGCSAPVPSEENADQSKEPIEEGGGEELDAGHLSLNSAGENGEQFQGESPSVSPSLREATDKQEGVAQSDAEALRAEPLTETMEIFAIFNKPKTQQRCCQYYSVMIPMKISKNGQMVNNLEANWLEHMTDHFRKGGLLVNAIFSLGMVNDSMQGFTDGVFVFEDLSMEDNKTIRGYDAIVVEQWTVLEGVEVQTDYIPLLNSLAVYGWQLTCVLPTPIVKTNREGNLATKQIVFLQRPSLPQKAKKKESKFHWRFSKEEMHNKQTKKSIKAKLSSREKQAAGEKQECEVIENTRNLEVQLSTIENVGNCKPVLNEHLDGVTDETSEIHGDKETSIHDNEESEEKGQPSHDTDQNEVEVCLNHNATLNNCEDKITHEGSCVLITDSCGGDYGAGSMDVSCD